MRSATRAQTNSGPQLVVCDIVQPAGMRAGCFNHQDLAGDRFEVGTEVHAAFDRNYALIGRLDAGMPEDCLIETLASGRADHDANVGGRVQYPQNRYRPQFGGDAAKHDAGKRECTIAESLDPETPLKGMLTFLP